MGRQPKRTKAYQSVSRRYRRSRPKVGKAARLMLMVTVTSLALLAIWMVAAKAARPYLISYGETKEIADIRQQIAEAEKENKGLKRDIGYLSKPQGMEAEARKLGWVKGGEIAVVVEKPPTPVEDVGQPASSTAHESFWQSAGHRLLKFFVRGKTAQ